MPRAAVAHCTAPDRELRMGEASGAETARAASCTPAAQAELLPHVCPYLSNLTACPHEGNCMHLQHAVDGLMCDNMAAKQRVTECTAHPSARRQAGMAACSAAHWTRGQGAQRPCHLRPSHVSSRDACRRDRMPALSRQRHAPSSVLSRQQASNGVNLRDGRAKCTRHRGRTSLSKLACLHTGRGS